MTVLPQQSDRLHARPGPHRHATAVRHDRAGQRSGRAGVPSDIRIAGNDGVILNPQRDPLAVPVTLQQALAPEWLERALAPISGGGAISSVQLAENIAGMASKLRIKVYFADAPDRARSFCLKAFLDSADGLAGGEIG